MNIELRMEQHSSWWDYVESTSQNKDEEDGDATPRPVQKSFPEVPDALPESTASPSSGDDNTKTLSPGVAPAISVSHEEQTSWYYPWACEEKQHTQDTDNAEPETALVDAPSSAAADTSPSAAESAATAAQQRYWTSFFSSSYSQPKSHAGTSSPVQTSESLPADAPSVMDIDLDEVTEDGDTTPASQSATPDKTKKEVNANKKEPEGMKEVNAKKESNGKQSKDDEPPRPNAKQPSAPPLTISDTVKRQVANNSSTGSISSKRASSPSPSVASKQSVASTGTKTPSKAPSIAPPRTPTPNLVLPTWGDTFHAPPRSVVPQRILDANGKTVGRAVMEKTMKFVSGVLFATESTTSKRRSASASGEEREREKSLGYLKPAAGNGSKGGSEFTEVKEGNLQDVLRGCKHVAVIGIHGWFPGAIVRGVLGEPTGTSTKFVNMMVSALEEFQSSYNVKLEKITCIPLEGEGTIERRVEKLYTALTSNAEWIEAVHAADVIFRCIDTPLDRLIRDGHIRTGGSDVSKDPSSPVAAVSSTAAAASLPAPPPQRVCCLALCGIHLGPLRYLNSSSLLLPYLQYFENAAAKELFEFQNTESEVSKAYVNALRNVVDNGIKMVYVASLNDQVVPIYSGLFASASHPLILRALYIDGDAYHSSDFLSNLLVLLIRVLNSGLPDSGLIAHLSEATAGSLNGVGHSTAYEELSNYSYAVKYLFLTNSGFDTHPKLTVEPFNANTEQNDYEIPWSLRDLVADERVAHFFSKEITELAAAFRHWHPKTTILRDIKRKLQPIQRLPPSFATPTNSASTSKL
ncbi:hypothetical protein B0H13DRAFT_1956043 [Mycena leptocephala]|nr:hypothetical protein B0H13DRAFT_1956043 [Mycena leptocephala]